MFPRNEPRSLHLDFQDNHRYDKFCNMAGLRCSLGLELELEQGVVARGHCSKSLDISVDWDCMMDG